ncbi:MAG: Glycerol-3-phosphate dehydrogenase (NAD(P)+) [Lentisphaerae bacterium ADurb.Bin242]|nr:MAG: Glycerol-3-phosphate dehydrogenase (NAD(P)+) [Lentisphaerae bacterium ADurb.Bin242]
MNTHPIRVTVLGDGAWGTALALVLTANRHAVTLWGPFPENLRTIVRTGMNPFLKGMSLPPELKIEEDIGKAVGDAELVVLAAPSQYMRGTLQKLQPHFRKEQHPLLNIAKGIETGSLLRMSEVCEQVLGDCRYAVLSGPSLAEEVAHRIPTAVVVASQDLALAKSIQAVFMNEFFRVYTGTDWIGVELGGSLKNVYAIAAGIIDGMGLGDNPKAALMTRAIAELSRLGIALGGKAQTFAGLSGVGDLIVTCMSRHSRNHFVGEELGKGRNAAEITASMGMVVAEGVKTSESALELSRKLGVETPLVETIHDIIYNGKPPREAVTELMTRKAKNEEE